MSPQTDRPDAALVELWTHPDPARDDYRAAVYGKLVRIDPHELNALTGVPVTPLGGGDLSVPRGLFAVLMREDGWTLADETGEAP